MKNGLLVAPGDVGQLTDGIIGLLSDEALAKRLGENGRAEACKSYDWDVIVDRLEEIYTRVIDGRSPTG